jgi:hypothetical protein
VTYRRALHLLIAVFISISVLAQEQPRSKADELADFIKANYTKYEFRIPMRDGVRLFTAVYIPKDASPAKAYPIMLDRTPYSVAPYGVDNYPRTIGPSDLFARSRYIFAYQDVRGRFLSDGQFMDMRPEDAAERGGNATDESTDTYDTVDWLVKNIANNNGKVGMWGISYPGFYSACALINSHPALKAVSPQAPIADWFIGDDFHHNGALYLPHFFTFISAFGLPRPAPTTQWTRPEFEYGTADGYNFFQGIEPLSLANDKYLHGHIAFWNETLQHPNYDAFWQARSLPQHLKDVKPATMTVGGWFDAEDLYGALHVYGAAEKNSPGATNMLVMGPWCHGCWARGDGDSLGDVSFNAKTAAYYRENIEFPFFEHYLKGAGDPKLPEAYVFETGTNQWRQYETWPPKNASEKSLYFGPNGTLSFSPPAEAEAFDEYVSDPAKPVPYVDRTYLGMLREHMDADQRLQGRRTDVLVYQTEPLEEDVTIAGPIRPSLVVSTSGTDSDFVVKLIDVYPPDLGAPQPNPAHIELGGYQQLVRGELFRGRYRNSFEKPEPFTPGQPAKIEYVMPDVNHTFGRGHRIMIQVQSSWFPLVDLNPQKFVDIYTAKPGDFQKATERVYRSRTAASRVNVLVLGR